MVKNLWKMLASFHKVFGLFIVLLVFYEGLQIADSYVMSAVIKFFGERAPLVTWVILFAILLIYAEVATRLDNIVDWHIIIKQVYPIYKHLKLIALSKFLELDMSWHQDKNSGALVGKVNNGVDKILEIVQGLSWEFVPTLIQTLLSLIPLIIFSPMVAIVWAISLFIFMSLTIKSNRERMPLRKIRHDLYEDEWHMGIETVQSVETLIMFGQESNKLTAYESIHNKIIDLGRKEVEIGNYYNRWRIRLLSFSRRLILALWVYQLYQGTIDIPILIFVNVLTERLFHSLWRFVQPLDRAAEASEAAERLINLSLETPNIIDPKGGVDIKYPIDISLQGVCFSYKGTYSGLDGAIHYLDIDIPGGSIVALVGRSGAGKTTLRKLVTRLIDIQEGNIYVSGVEVRKWPLTKLRSLFSYVPQGDDVFIYSGTVKENIALPRPDAPFEEIREAASLAGIDSFIANELSDSYETLLGERGKKLSGGQKQRMALARAFLAQRPVLILDEATSMVDAITEEEIQGNLQSFLVGKTVIIVAHRLSTIKKLAHKIVVLEKGMKIEEGTHQELIDLRGMYFTMAELQKLTDK